MEEKRIEKMVDMEDPPERSCHWGHNMDGGGDVGCVGLDINGNRNEEREREYGLQTQ